MGKELPSSPRFKALQLMRQAIKLGRTQTSTFTELAAEGLGYRRSTMREDWQQMKEVTTKEGLLQEVARNRLPTEQSIAAVKWELSAEYMFKVRVLTQTKPDEPIQERFVNILSAKNLTPRAIEEQVLSRWGEWEKYVGEAIKELKVWTAYRKVS